MKQIFHLGAEGSLSEDDIRVELQKGDCQWTTRGENTEMDGTMKTMSTMR